jgi:N utilization substance protein A
LIDYGLAEATVDALVKGDIGTVEKLGSMTPEQLEALEGIDAEAVNRIQQAINSFYGQEYEAPAGIVDGVVAAESLAVATESETAAIGADGAIAPGENASVEDTPADTVVDTTVEAESSASDTMMEPPETIGDRGAEGQPGAETKEGEGSAL